MNPSTKARGFFFVVSLLVFVVLLSGCSFNKDDATMVLADTNFEYYEDTGMTKVSCLFVIDNDTIYNINSFDIDLGIASNGVRIETEPFHYELRVKHETEKTAIFQFYMEGEIDDAGLVSYTPNYEPFWKIVFTIFGLD